jgi:hypothetical protein
MKVLKVTYEIPLGARTAAQDLKKAAEMVARFSADLAEAGFESVGRVEAIVGRPGEAR